MIEIPLHYHLPIFQLLAFAIPAAAAAVLLLYLAHQGAQLRSVLARGTVVGVVCAAASAAFWSTRGAGTGTQTAWGWPRMVYTRWVSWETAERNDGIRWQGLAENAMFYGAAATLVGSLLVVARQRPRPDRRH